MARTVDCLITRQGKPNCGLDALTHAFASGFNGRFRLLRDATLSKPQVTKSPLGDGQEYAGTFVSNANQIEIQESS